MITYANGGEKRVLTEVKKGIGLKFTGVEQGSASLFFPAAKIFMLK